MLAMCYKAVGLARSLNMSSGSPLYNINLLKKLFLNIRNGNLHSDWGRLLCIWWFLLTIKIWHTYDWKKNLASIADVTLWTNTNQVAFIQLNLQVLCRLFKYAFCVSERVYGIVLEPLFGIVGSLSHSGSLPHLHQSMCAVINGRSYQGKVVCGGPSLTKFWKSWVSSHVSLSFASSASTC